MSLKKTITIDTIGAPASFHVIDNLYLNKGSNFMSVTLKSYFSDETYGQNKQPLSMSTVVMFNGIPPAGVDPFAYAESLLVQAEPKDGTPDPTIYPALPANRYLFAGAEIVA
ncbi:hypothetical protein [Paraburkholderia domus]|uniref:Uncharacterized protein n=1 Tax=Paraburkholderia domus TaxID=2793075 RepID=A0A9N8QTT1_9BURK|nr:hypothetical protein [Paraburkholderia domus]MBK5163937.1 hypothetical protein [Burkholderia sp. R-70211]CAE6856160.1 hypothetical protein R70211_00175 [Paraburkholderia domus]